MRLNDDIEREIKALKPKIIEVRRDLHENPERSKREKRTSGLIAGYLESLGLESEGDSRNRA